VSAVLEAQEPSARYLADAQPSLLRQFEILATAPGGVARLRELILKLAVRGTLVPQRPSDEPAAVLLERSRSERGRLGAGDKVNRDAQPLPLAIDNQPFDLPMGWEWSCLAEIGRWAVGSGFPHEAQGREGLPILFAKVSDMNLPGNELEIARTNHTIDEETVERLRINVHPAGTVIFPKIGGAIATNKRRILIRPTAIDNNCLGITPCKSLSTEYLFLLLTSIDFTAYQAGTSVPALSQVTLGKVVVALPPQAEQSRIVARVNELMRLCDALEAKGRLEAEQHARLLGTLLGTLTDSSTPEELAANWQRVADHFDLLLDRPETVDALEQTMLQLAVRGLLVQQDPSDESASELVRRIRSYRDEQVKSGLARRERPFTPLSEADLPFELPTGWEWIRFDDLIEPAKPISYGVLVPGPDIDRGVPFVRIADLSLTDPPAKPEKSISTEVDAQYQRTRLEGGEILMGVVGSIGKLGVAPPSWAGANIARAICRIVPVGLVDYGFVLLLLQSKFMRDSFAGDTRTLAQPTLNVGLIRSSATPLPPIAEQARIVARVTEIRRICADLRQRLERSGTTQASLADALIEQAQSA
jgi:type I restriction enzyme S subunit